MVIQRRAEIEDDDNHGHAENGIEALHDLLQPFLRHHIRESGGKRHADEHEIEHRAGQQAVAQEPYAGGNQNGDDEEGQGNRRRALFFQHKTRQQAVTTPIARGSSTTSAIM